MRQRIEAQSPVMAGPGIAKHHGRRRDRKAVHTGDEEVSDEPQHELLERKIGHAGNPIATWRNARGHYFFMLIRRWASGSAVSSSLPAAYPLLLKRKAVRST